MVIPSEINSEKKKTNRNYDNKRQSVTVSTSMMQLPVDLCDPQLKKDKPELGKKKKRQ